MSLLLLLADTDGLTRKLKRKIEDEGKDKIQVGK